MQRAPELSSLIQALLACLRSRVAANAGPARALVRHLEAATTASVGMPGDEVSCALPVCRYIEPALGTLETGGRDMAALAHAFGAVAPRLHWRGRSDGAGDSQSFRDGHANTQIIGPGGLERRSDLVLGASLLAPHTTYPNHHHPPRELYLVMSVGDWFREGVGWYTPGLGGTIYHAANVVHAIRSCGAPLLAVWCLWPESGAD